MRKYVFIAAVLILALSLVSCDMIDKINVFLPEQNATVGDRVEKNESVPTDEADVTVLEATSSSMTAVITNNTDSTWQSGNMRDYRLEVKKDGEWYEVKQVGELANTMELMLFAPGETMTHTFEFSNRYGILPAGEYRVVKSFWANSTATTEAHEFYLVCEFTVE
jgi:hypothetical protein